MTIYTYKIIYVLLAVLFMGTFGSACDDIRLTEFLHKETTAGNHPIVNSSCTLWLNNSNSYVNSTNNNGWVLFCYNATDAYITNTTCVKPATYNAVLNESRCQNFVYLGNVETFTFKITNTLGEALEAQDCYVKTFYNDTAYPYMVEDLGTNLLYNNQTFIDGNGNYVRLSGVPISSSNGNYGVSWPINEYDKNGHRLYRPYQSYYVSADCNGKVINCSFEVGNAEPMHMGEDAQWYMDNMQVVSFVIVSSLIIWFFVIPALKKGGFWAGGGND